MVASQVFLLLNLFNVFSKVGKLLDKTLLCKLTTFNDGKFTRTFVISFQSENKFSERSNSHTEGNCDCTAATE